MAENNKKDNTSTNPTNEKRFNRFLNNVNGLINDLNISLYGTSNTNKEIDELNSKFNSIMKTEIESITKNSTDDLTSFMNQLYSKDKKESSLENMLKKQFSSLNVETEDSSVAAFISEQYRNRLVRQGDIHEIASQLIELREAISVTRDAIVSPDIVTGKINRNIDFKDYSDYDNENSETYIPAIEAMEDKFELHDKIKNFIIQHGLEYGEYYVYVIPYSVIFNDFINNKDKYITSKYGTNLSMYGESVLDDSILDDDESTEDFIERCFNEYASDKIIASENKFSDSDVISRNISKQDANINKANFKKEFTKDMTDILSRVTVNNMDIPLPVLEEGFESFKMFRDEYVNESGDRLVTEAERSSRKLKTDEDVFNRMLNSSDSKDGLFFNDKSIKKENFNDIRDCYLKMIEPTRVVPITIMDEEIGYFYLQVEDVTSLSGILSSTLYHQRYDEHRRENDIIGNIAERIIRKFDKKFLKTNPKFKKMIVEAINYYNLNEKQIKFQFIPKEYMVSFKINKDVEGHGVSMLEPSLFYAKLYLMLLLFKMMSIITNSNDTKVNYVKQSGIDKNVINKVQDIARQKQARRIHIMDLFSYTTLINKIGNGTELYLPVGQSGDRPIETEILSGQDVQINSELMELLRNSYILGTGVPSAIMNYLNEADFAKSIETANTKFNGRVVNYRIDFNKGLTELYKKLAKWCTNIPEDKINVMQISLPSSKGNTNTAKSEMVSNFQPISDFLTQLYFGERIQNPEYEEHVMRFRKALARENLTMFDFEEIDKTFETTRMESKKDKLDPSNPKEDDDI